MLSISSRRNCLSSAFVADFCSILVSKHGVSHTFILQQFSIVISHCVAGREVICVLFVTLKRLVMRGRFRSYMRRTVHRIVTRVTSDAVNASETYTTVRLKEFLQYVTCGSTKFFAMATPSQYCCISGLPLSSEQNRFGISHRLPVYSEPQRHSTNMVSLFRMQVPS